MVTQRQARRLPCSGRVGESLCSLLQVLLVVWVGSTSDFVDRLHAMNTFTMTEFDIDGELHHAHPLR